MPAFEDLTGRRFGRLVVLRRAETRNTKTMWLCRCSCGNQKSVDSHSLKSGHTRSCGCLHNELLSKQSKKHGMVNTRLYRIWINMKNRCGNENVPCYEFYGGRGIRVCDEWSGANGFECFCDWSLSHGYSDNLTLDRKDTNGNYEPLNCRWITQKEQMNNTRANRMIEFRGEIKTLSEMAEKYGLPYQRVCNRINSLGWDIERALTTPINKNMGRKRNAG